MAIVTTNNLDYLTTRLHARRNRMVEGEHLDALCRCRTLPELAHLRYPELVFFSAEHFQRQLVQDLIQELSSFRKHLDEAGHEFVTGLLAQFQLENIKILLRGLVNHLPLEKFSTQLVVLPADLSLNLAALAAAGSIGIFAAKLPSGNPRDRLEEMLMRAQAESSLFLLEAALDCGYYEELLERTMQLADEKIATIKPLVSHEANHFQLMLIVRGKFLHGLTAETMLPLRVAGSGVSGYWFKKLLAATDIFAIAKFSLGIVLDELPASRTTGEIHPATLEALAWNRFQRLANSAFRRSHMGLGAVIGYAALRRIEVANLITLAEGIRLGVDTGKIRARLIPRSDLEVAHV